MTVAYYAAHYRRQPLAHLLNAMGMAPTLAEAGAAPGDWVERLEGMKLAIARRGRLVGRIVSLDPVSQLVIVEAEEREALLARRAGQEPRRSSGGRTPKRVSGEQVAGDQGAQGKGGERDACWSLVLRAADLRQAGCFVKGWIEDRRTAPRAGGPARPSTARPSAARPSAARPSAVQETLIDFELDASGIGARVNVFPTYREESEPDVWILRGARPISEEDLEGLMPGSVSVPAA